MLEILGSFMNCPFLIIPVKIQQPSWMESVDHNPSCQSRRWIPKDGPTHTYTCQGLITQVGRLLSRNLEINLQYFRGGRKVLSIYDGSITI
jgi:hypothetical protein